MTLTRSALPFAALALVAIAAFWKPYLSALPPGPVLLHLHALTVALWIGLLVLQPLLIRRGQRTWHRRIGRVAWGLAPLVVLSSLLLAWHMTTPAPGAAIEPFRYGLFFVQVGTSLLFGAFAAGALAWRGEVALHARCMVASGVTFVDPVFARVVMHLAPPWLQIDYASSLIALGLALALAVADRHAVRGRWIFRALSVALAGMAAAGLWIGDWAPWRGVVERLFA